MIVRIQVQTEVNLLNYIINVNYNLLNYNYNYN